jgi:hypothetical protein
MNAPATVRELLDRGHAEALQLLLQGESPWSTREPTNLSDVPTKKLLSAAWCHVRFIAMFGICSGSAELAGRSYSAYPDEFDSWLALDCPGLDKQDLADLYNHSLHPTGKQ